MKILRDVETGEIKTLKEIKEEFNELKGNTNEFNDYELDEYIKEYYFYE